MFVPEPVSVLQQKRHRCTLYTRAQANMETVTLGVWRESENESDQLRY